MTRPLPLHRLAAAVGAGAFVLAAPAATAQTVLIDFGADSTYRGASVVNPDPNGNHWTSVDSAQFYADIVGIDGVQTSVDFGFSSATGTDSYNGPAGTATSDPSASVYNASALGDLGVDEAVFDYYTDSTFQIQNLDPLKTYDLTFYGAHKYNEDNVTRYTAYTDGTFSTPIASVDLEVGVNEAHNTDATVQLTGLSPDALGIIYVGFESASGGFATLGYLNALKVAEVPDISFPAQPVGMVVDPGGTLAFTATVNANDPSPTYRWRKDGVDLVDDGRIAGATTTSLSIADAGSADIAEYTLVVSIPGGASAESTTVVGGVRPSADRFDVNGDGVVDFFDLAELLNVL